MPPARVAEARPRGEAMNRSSSRWLRDDEGKEVQGWRVATGTDPSINANRRGPKPEPPEPKPAIISL